jgi:hypothetical protein
MVLVSVKSATALVKAKLVMCAFCVTAPASVPFVEARANVLSVMALGRCIVDKSSVHLVIDGSSTDEQFEEDFAGILQEAFELCKRKQASYGPGNIHYLGERGVFVRLFDKVQRLKRLVWENRDNPLDDETVEDTWMDILNYAAIALMVHRGLWPNPE